MSQNKCNNGLDFVFRCNNCIKLIPDGSPVYMRNDYSYCSTGCREKGVSNLYAKLVETQLAVAKSLMWQRSNSLNSINSKSDSSLYDKSEKSSLGEDPHSIIEDQLFSAKRLGRFGLQIIDRVLRGVSSKHWGDKMLRTYSSGLIWGRSASRNSSMSFVFSYFPEVDEYIGSDPAHTAADDSSK